MNEPSTNNQNYFNIEESGSSYVNKKSHDSKGIMSNISTHNNSIANIINHSSDTALDNNLNYLDKIKQDVNRVTRFSFIYLVYLIP